MFRCQWIVSVEFIEFSGYLRSHSTIWPVSPWNFRAIKVGNFVLGKEAEISYWQRHRHGRSIEVICVHICAPTVGFGRVVPLHQRVLGLGMSVQDRCNPAPHIVFDYQVPVRLGDEVEFSVRIF